MSNKLKPCPFCGGKAEFTKEKILKIYAVQCTECSSRSKFYFDFGKGEKESKREAAEAWNTRKPMDKIVKQLEKLKKYEANSACPKDGMCDEVGRTCTVCYTTSAIEIVKKGGE